MRQEPQIQERAAQHYAGIPMTVTMDGLSSAVDSAFSELFGWLASEGITPAGPPFIRYLVIEMAGDVLKSGSAPIAGSDMVQQQSRILRREQACDKTFEAH